jgi:LPPG:FO 2-phospho-L-lactate transferase
VGGEGMPHILALVGGVGGAKLAHGLAQILPPDDLTIIVNTGDDFDLYDLRVCPDLDTVMYTLSGVVDPVNGWGVKDDSDGMLSALRRYGEQPWFGLRDRDLATHLLRTQALRGGERLTDVTRRLTNALGIKSAVLPMTDSDAPTIVDTVEYGRLPFQEYFVRYHWQPTIRGLEYGSEGADLTPEARTAIQRADVILIAPSNPWLSIAPLLALRGARDLLMTRNVPRLAVTPIISGKAIKGPAAKIMQELGFEVSARAVAEYYGEIINGFVYDERDMSAPPPRIHHLMLDTLMTSDADRARLARQTLAWIATPESS